MKRNGNNAFTLVEMLAVLVIMGIMIGIGIVAFTRVAQGAKLQTAGRELFNTMRLARQYGITHHCQAAVVFPYEDTAVSEIAPRFRSYAVMTNAIDDYGRQWAYLTGWRVLPEGVVVEFASSSPLLSQTNAFPTSASPPPLQPLRVANWWNGNLEGDPTEYIYLREGYYDAAYNLVRTSTNSIEFRLWRSGGLEMNRQ